MEYAQARTRCPEEVLLFAIHEIRKIRRENMEKQLRARLLHEDDREERELRSYVAHSLTSEMLMTVPGAGGQARPSEEIKTPAERQQEAATPWNIMQHRNEGQGR